MLPPTWFVGTAYKQSTCLSPMTWLDFSLVCVTIHHQQEPWSLPFSTTHWSPITVVETRPAAISPIHYTESSMKVPTKILTRLHLYHRTVWFLEVGCVDCPETNKPRAIFSSFFLRWAYTLVRVLHYNRRGKKPAQKSSNNGNNSRDHR